MSAAVTFIKNTCATPLISGGQTDGQTDRRTAKTFIIVNFADQPELPPDQVGVVNQVGEEMANRMARLEVDLRRHLTHLIAYPIRNAAGRPLLLPVHKFEVYRPHNVPPDPDLDSDSDSDSDSDDEDDPPVGGAPAAGPPAAGPPAAGPPAPFVGGCNIHGMWPGTIRGGSLMQDERYAFFYDGACEVVVHTGTCPGPMKAAIAAHCTKIGEGCVYFGELLARGGSAIGATIPSCLSAISGGSLKMYEASKNGKHGLTSYLPWGQRCIVTFTSLMDVNEGWMVAKPISTNIAHGYWTPADGGGRTYQIVGGGCRLSIATHGGEGSLISRSKKGWAATDESFKRSCTLYLATREQVRNHPRLVGPRDPNDTSKNSGFRNLHNGEKWDFHGQTLYKTVESDFAADWAIARRIPSTRGTYSIIDEISMAMAPEHAGGLPANCFVFSACRNTPNGRGAFTGTRDRREEMPGAGSGERKPERYWQTLLPHRRAYYGNPVYHRYGNRQAKNLAAEAGAALKRIGWPVFIALYENGHIRHFHLFSQFVDFLVYYDLKVWQSIVRDPQHSWPQPIQP